MGGLLSVGTRALQANQVALQTAGNNIANVNTAGYSRQTVSMGSVLGQYTGAGYIGKGVEVVTIKRELSAFLTTQSALAGATQAGDAARASKLQQLQEIFSGGANGLGAAVSDMLNAFSDVASAPTDLTARAVVLTRVDETASRMRTASQQLDDFQQGLTQELNQNINRINDLATSIADVNELIARAQGSGQPPNDLLDRREQMVRDLNKYVQTTSIPADDGTMGIFIAGSQALVLGNKASAVSLTADAFGVKNQKLAITRDGQSTTMDENMLGGGEVSGLLRFQNADLAEGRNLLGRFTMAVTASMNEQHGLGLDLDGKAGGNLFSTIDISGNVRAGVNNSGTNSITLVVSDKTKLVASDYEVSFSTATGGTVTRRSDGVKTAFSYTPNAAPAPAAGTFNFLNPADNQYNLTSIDGLSLSTVPGSAHIIGNSFLVSPFSTSANSIRSEFSSPRALAVASAVAGRMGSANTGSLQFASLTARTNPPTNVPVVITFTGANTYTRSDYVGALSPFTYTSGQVIEGSVPATTPLSQWSLKLQGTPANGDTFTVQAQPGAYQNSNAGNAGAMMDLRDMTLFDGAKLTDGYAALIAQVGIRTQSANYAAEVSGAIAANLETERTGVAGVNLDEEAAKLLQFQQAYQASAKMIQIAQSIFDTLIQTLAR
jgi:flagellar hook-associated protein 1 FlgK